MTMNPALDKRDRRFMSAHLGYCDARGNVYEGRQIPTDERLLREYAASTGYWSEQNISATWKGHWRSEHRRAVGMLAGVRPDQWTEAPTS